MSAYPPPSHSKSWWSRSKSTRDAPSLRTQASGSNLAQDARAQASYGSPKPKDHSTGSKFNSFVASAMGKKHKKPTLTIQDPPPPLITSFSTPPSLRSANSPSTITSGSRPYYVNRPPAGSVSTARSYEVDVDQASDHHTVSEPRTPSDHPRDRRSYQNSVMTLSDPDPFAAGSVIVSRFDQDPNRLSVYSDSSLLDPHAKRGEFVQSNRISYGSSSSNSHGNADGQSSSQTLQLVSRMPSEGSAVEKRHNREASVLMDNFDPSIDLHYPDEESYPASRLTAPRARVVSAASSTVLPAHYGSNTFRDAAITPQLRPRGMTVAGEVKRPPPVSNPPSANSIPIHTRRQEHFSRSGSPTAPSESPIMFSSARSSLSTMGSTPPPPPTRPLVLIRKASSSRMALPPLSSAPPSNRLPPPPPSPFGAMEDESLESLVFPDVPSSSSSSLSFASMNTDIPSGDEILHFMRDGFIDDPLEESGNHAHSPPATLRDVEVDVRPKSTASSLNPRGYSQNGESQSGFARALKKAASQQNLMGKRHSELSVVSSASSASGEGSASSQQVSPSSKGPRKQRSFHHPRLPLPPLPPLRYTNSSNNAAVHSTEQGGLPSSPPLTPSTPQHTRRRLFSGSSGRRTSLSKASSPPPPTADDDIRSLLSLDASSQTSHSQDTSTQASRNRPIMMSFTNMGNQLSLVTDNACIAPMWDEIGSYTSPAPKRTSQSEYVPQHIMSPSDMLKLEERLASESSGHVLDEEYHQEPDRMTKSELDPGDLGLAFVGNGRPRTTRSRTNSILSNMSSASAGTLAFGNVDRSGGEDASMRGVLLQHTIAGSPPRRPVTANAYDRLPYRGTPTLGGKSPSRPIRPSTAQASISLSPPTSPSKNYNRPSPDHPSVSLPPPPRPRPTRDQMPKVAEEDSPSYRRISIAPVQALSPPPRRRTARTVTMEEEPEQTRQSSFSSRPPSAFDPQKLLNRRSIMRKPSFLDFEDEMDPDEDAYEDAPQMRLSPTEMESSSFLDLDRGKDSFDTIRSCDDNVHMF